MTPWWKAKLGQYPIVASVDRLLSVQRLHQHEKNAKGSDFGEFASSEPASLQQREKQKKAAPFGATLFKEAKWRESEET